MPHSHDKRRWQLRQTRINTRKMWLSSVLCIAISSGCSDVPDDAIDSVDAAPSDTPMLVLHIRKNEWQRLDRCLGVHFTGEGEWIATTDADRTVELSAYGPGVHSEDGGQPFLTMTGKEKWLDGDTAEFTLKLDTTAPVAIGTAGMRNLKITADGSPLYRLPTFTEGKHTLVVTATVEELFDIDDAPAATLPTD